MITSTDSIFIRGKTHQICEDFALHGEITANPSPLPYAIIADGCSSSQNTDTGARLIAMALKAALEEHCKQNHSRPGYATLGIRAIARAAAAAYVIGAPDTALDTTAGLLTAIGDNAHIYLYGDGNIIIRRHDNTITLIIVAFARNAPYYPSYWIDRQRNYQYRQMHKESPLEAKTITTITPEKMETTRCHYAKETVFAVPLRELHSITVLTDGLQSFPDFTEPAHLYWLAQEATSYKVLKGAFLQRRIRKLLAQLQKQGADHMDDLAAAALIVTHCGKETQDE